MSSTSGSEDGAALPANGSFSFDGSTSDIARQLYLRHTAGESTAKVAPNTLPNVVTERLSSLGVSYSDLPGLLQRAVLWDCGVAITPANDAVQIQTLGGRSMAHVAVSKLEFDVTDCTAFNCTQPNNETCYANEFCTGTQMLTAVKCLMEDFGSDARENLAMWSNGGDPDMTPEIRAVKHSWLDSSSNESYVVYAVHTMRVDSEPPYGSCNSGGYGSLVVPCHGTRGASADVLAVMTQPVASPWVTTWLKTYQSTTEATVGQTSSEGAGFNLLLMIPIVFAALMVTALVVFLLIRRRRMQRNAHWQHDASFNRSFCMTPQTEAKPATLRSLVRPNARADLSSLHRTEQETMGEFDQTLHLPAFRAIYSSNPGIDHVLRTLSNDPSLIGKQILWERIEIDRLLAKGAFGEVWACRFAGEEVAVKRLLQSKKPTFNEIQDFTNEIQLTASLTHPNIVRFIGVAWSSLENLVMVEELLPRGDLQRYLRQKGDLMTWARDKIYIAIGVAEALRYLHTRAIVHRDVKARNVLLTSRLEPKLIDFGASRVRTAEQMTAGVETLYWTAPEVLEGTGYTEKADVYSFGVLLSELDTCQAPYYDTVGSKPLHILKEVVDGSLTPSFTLQCPQRIRKAANACFQRNPKLRPSAADLAKLLEG